MEKAPKRAPECEFIVKKSYGKRSYGNHPYVSCVLHSAYFSLMPVVIQALTPLSLGPLLRAEHRQGLPLPAGAERSVRAHPSAGAAGAAPAPLAPECALRAAVPAAAAETAAHESPKSPESGQMEANVWRRRGQRQARPGRQRRWRGRGRCRGGVRGGCRGRAGPGPGAGASGG